MNDDDDGRGETWKLCGNHSKNLQKSSEFIQNPFVLTLHFCFHSIFGIFFPLNSNQIVSIPQNDLSISLVPSLHFLFSFVKAYGERQLENVQYHDVNIMGNAGLDVEKGERNNKIILSVLNNLSPHINVTHTADNRIVLHRHSFMSFVREEGRRYQSLQQKGKTYQLMLNTPNVIKECFSEFEVSTK